MLAGLIAYSAAARSSGVVEQTLSDWVKGLEPVKPVRQRKKEVYPTELNLVIFPV